MSLSKLLSSLSGPQQRMSNHASSAAIHPRLQQPNTSSNSHQVLPPKKASIPLSHSPVKHESKRRPSRQPAAKEANLSSDDDDPTLHDLSISKSLALQPSIVPKMKQQTLQATSLKKQVFAQTQKLLKSTNTQSLTRQPMKQSSSSKPPVHDLTPTQSIKSNRVPNISSKQSPHPSLQPKQLSSRVTATDKKQPVSKQKPNQIEITTARQHANQRKQSLPNKQKVLEFLSPNQKVQKTTRSVTNNSHLDSQQSRQEKDCLQVSAGSAASAPLLHKTNNMAQKSTPTIVSKTTPSQQLSKANLELVKLFKMIEPDVADLDCFPHLQQLLRAQKQPNFPKAVNQFDQQYQRMLQQQSGTTSSISVYQKLVAPASRLKTNEPYDCDSTDEYLKVDQAPQKIRNSSVQKNVTPQKTVNPMKVPSKSLIEQNKALLGQLILVRLRLKNTVQSYQDQIVKQVNV